MSQTTQIDAPFDAMTGAELFAYEADAAEHGTGEELQAVRREIAARLLRDAAVCGAG